ncbi:hypothetical protein KSP40_PGU018112 [Platanthera guangdongensis]|uniref:hydroxyethylthiazole kinase n=1 Tax=Platanthera guangdongensis TaxID=2320717 RepID=A0ABR2MH78_9ASPA
MDIKPAPATATATAGMIPQPAERNSPEDRWGRRAWELLEKIRRRTPLVQCITNFVSMDLMANVLLASGASPAMLHSLQEISDFTPGVDALCINIGTLSEDWLPSMRAAAAAAAEAGRPWVLDPVAVSASDYRMEACIGLLELRPAAIRGNASEILGLVSSSRFGKNKVNWTGKTDGEGGNESYEKRKWTGF